MSTKKLEKLTELRKKAFEVSEAVQEGGEVLDYGNLYRTMVDTLERGLLDSMLDNYKGNQFQIALALGINRATLKTKLVRHGFID